jgi:hypothetical protein
MIDSAGLHLLLLELVLVLLELVVRPFLRVTLRSRLLVLALAAQLVQV